MLNANNASELLAALAELDITVPRRSDGRTKSHTERYAVAHLISALVEAEIIHYPMNISQRERPDFLLSMAEIQIGIEHTEAVPENEAHKTFLREKGGGSGVHYMSRNRPGEPKLSAMMRAMVGAVIQLSESGQPQCFISLSRRFENS